MSFLKKLSLLFIILMNLGFAAEEVQLNASEQKALKADAMRLWEKRVNQESLEEALSKFELIHAANPKDFETLVYLTRGNFFLADSHLEDAEVIKKKFEKAISFGEAALALNEAYSAKLEKGKSVEESLDTMTIKDVPALYWTAASLGKWVKTEGLFTRMKNKDRIKSMAERVEKLQPDFFFGAASRYLGGFYALAPSIAGGDLNKSKAHFENSIKMAPEYLGTKVLMAEVYWTQKDDKKAFEAMLREVLMSNQNTHQEIGPENTMEKKKAEKLLENMEKLF